MNRTQASPSRAQQGSALPITSISMVIPAYNDETTIAKLVQDTDCLLKELSTDYEIVLLNDGSKDNTLAILHDLAKKFSSVRVVNHEVNQGYGKTIKELYYAGTKDLVMSLPGDYQLLRRN